MRGWRLWVVVAVALLASPSAHADVEIALVEHHGGLVVEASFNRRLRGRFLLDTGATYCVLSEDAARTAKIKGRTGGDDLRLQTANGMIRARLGQARRVEVGRAAAKDVAVAVVPGDPVPGLDGIVGLSFLENFVYTVDTEAGVLRLGN